MEKVWKDEVSHRCMLKQTATQLEAHTAIARAFGDTTLQHPCLRLLDEPLLWLRSTDLSTGSVETFETVGTIDQPKYQANDWDN